MEIISIRLDKVEEFDFLSKLMKENRSELLRELVEKGRTMKALELYQTKKISLGLAAKVAGVPLSEFIDVLETYKIEFNIELEDAQAAMKYAQKNM